MYHSRKSRLLLSRSFANIRLVVSPCMYGTDKCSYTHCVHVGAPHTPAKPDAFASGDHVKVELDVETFAEMQIGHGGCDMKTLSVRD